MTLTLKEAEATLEPRDAGALKTKQKISEGIELLNYRQKLVKMADFCTGGKVVQEYTSNPLLRTPMMTKKIIRVQTRAECKVKAEKAKKKRPPLIQGQRQRLQLVILITTQHPSHHRSLVSATTVLNLDIGSMSAQKRG